MKSREERVAEYERVRALLPRATEELMRYPGVRDVGVGTKETEDKVTDTIAFRVYVDEKKPLSELPPAARIPKEVQGVPTDVVIEGIPELHVDDDKYRPLIGGTQIGNDANTALGTMGCLARLTADSSIVILSNDHVMTAGGAAKGAKIGQPEIACCCCCKCNVVGELLNSVNNGIVDCAIAKLAPGTLYTNEVVDIGFIFGSAPANSSGDTVMWNDRVMKRGRTTGLTRGTVTNQNKTTPAGDATANPPIPTRTHQIEIKPDPEYPKFSDHGDSGSVILNEDNVVVGLLWGGPGSLARTYANQITDVIAALGISIIDSGTPGTVPLAGRPMSTVSIPVAAQFADGEDVPLYAVLRALSDTDTGREAREFADRHGREINRLLENDRHVKVSWHRYHGPEFTAHVIESAKNPEHRIPREIEGVSPVNLLLRMSVVLQEQGSESLAAAVAEQTIPLLNLIEGCDSLASILDRVQAHERAAPMQLHAMHAAGG